jgi:hypothetical protein
MKGKPWTVKQEKQLRELVADGKDVNEISGVMEKSYASVAAKMRRLNIIQEDNNRDPAGSQLLSTLELPEDLPSVEEQMLVLAGALKELQKGGLDKSDVMRLRSIIVGVKAYKELFADYVDYRGIEQKVEEAVKLLRRLEQERKSMERKKG